MPADFFAMVAHVLVDLCSPYKIAVNGLEGMLLWVSGCDRTVQSLHSTLDILHVFHSKERYRAKIGE